ncbi:MAG: hypothetical protein U9R21_05160 [Candidatus Thermoplasmatota archaeon]|nr:hypothetical protein [Candidatus Thermoplasmatota archaeon]
MRVKQTPFAQFALEVELFLGFLSQCFVLRYVVDGFSSVENVGINIVCGGLSDIFYVQRMADR